MKITHLFFILLAVSACKKDAPVSPKFDTSYFVDPRDHQVYKTIKIGNQWWMAENLNVYSEYSYYYNSDSVTYAKAYGRLYYWQAIMNGQAASNSNPSHVQA